MGNSRALGICRDLVNFNTVTPGGIEILNYVSSILSKLGFHTQILTFESDDKSNVVHNLFAERKGKAKKHLGFLGHLDTVPPGEGWNTDPFQCVEKDSCIYGRGIADMKGGVACFLAALEEKIDSIKGRVSIFLTCDEEIGSYEGMQALLNWAQANHKIPDHCLIGEPSSKDKIGDRIYLGHRGSVNILATAKGTQTHSAYVTHATKNNALEKMCAYVQEIMAYKFYNASGLFPECIVSPTMINNSNVAVNVIPGTCSVNFNVRFPFDYEAEDIAQIFTDIAEKYGISIDYTKSGDAYICREETLLDITTQAVLDTQNYEPRWSTAGGTSDGRFMVEYCPVVELGMIDRTIHQPNEHIHSGDCYKLTEIYKRFLDIYFAN